MASIMVVAGGTDPKYLRGKSTLAEVEVLSSGSNGTCSQLIQEPVGFPVDSRLGETSAAVEGAVGKNILYPRNHF